jgi:hypothetical protein
MTRDTERRKRMREEAKWLLTLVGEDWGIRVLPAGATELRPVHANRNERFEAVIGSRQRGRQAASGKSMLDELVIVPWEEGDQEEEAPARRTWLQRLSQRRIMRHFEGAPREFRIGGETVIKPETFYFTGQRSRRGETCLTLLMLDVDAHKVGNLENAMEFAGRLRERFLPDCYVETSTNGKGSHIFLIVDKTDWADPDYNAMLRELDRWLKAALVETGIELDTVEVKGSCATVSWKDGMPKHTAGTLAKLPREWERFDELRQSPVYNAHQLLALVHDNPIETRGLAPKMQTMRQSGSVLCQGIDPERLERWIEVGRKLLPAAVRVGKSVNNRLVVTGEDVGITCALLEFVGKRMNGDGTLPWARTKGLWDCLYERGVVRRSFNAKRFAWIRRFLDGAGLVEVQDPTYVIGERAAKWSPSAAFWELASSIDKEGEEEQDFTETTLAIDPQECWEKGVPLVPIGVQAKESAERRRMDELVEAIVGRCNWNLAA